MTFGAPSFDEFELVIENIALGNLVAAREIAAELERQRKQSIQDELLARECRRVARRIRRRNKMRANIRRLIRRADARISFRRARR